MLILYLRTYLSNEVDSLVDGFSVQTAGIQAGDKIIEINGEKINNKYDLDEEMNKVNSEEINVKIDRNGEIIDLKVKPTEVKSKVTGIYLDEEAKIVTTDKESPAEKAGIENNDIILKINGEDVDETMILYLKLMEKM